MLHCTHDSKVVHDTRPSETQKKAFLPQCSTRSCFICAGAMDGWLACLYKSGILAYGYHYPRLRLCSLACTVATHPLCSLSCPPPLPRVLPCFLSLSVVFVTSLSGRPGYSLLFFFSFSSLVGVGGAGCLDVLVANAFCFPFRSMKGSLMPAGKTACECVSSETFKMEWKEEGTRSFHIFANQSSVDTTRYTKKAGGLSR